MPGAQQHRTVSAVKARLSDAENATLSFRHGKVAVERQITRAEF